MIIDINISLYEHLNLIRKGLTGNNIRLEACSICQLKCPLCSTGKGKNKEGIIGGGYLSFDNFRGLIEKNKWIKNIELSNWGEIFLNPELKQIMEYSYHNNITLTAGNGSNLNYLPDELAESLVKYKIKYLSVSIDGFSQGVYSIYRQGGNIEKVIENIKLINSYKKKYNFEFPKLVWQYIIFGHNENEIKKAKSLSKELDMRFKPKLNWNKEYSPVKNMEKVKKAAKIPAASRKEYYELTGKEYKQPCLQLWYSPQINWDGKLLGCCVNRFSDFGNVFEEGLIPLLKSRKYTFAKSMLLGKNKFRNDIPCLECDRYIRNK
jgi:MoaA/NifB/PqqE/SkfB family radical SAM enzyme